VPASFARGSEGTIQICTAVLAGALWVRKRLPRPFGNAVLLLLIPLWGLVLFFFRDPERSIPTSGSADLVVSPADGKVVSIDVVDDPVFILGPAVRIGIFMSIWDVHVNRSPVGGKVTLVRRIPGKFLQAFRSEASEVNEHILLGLQAGPRRVLVKQIAGTLARRCVNYATVGEYLEPGERFGLIRFSSRVDLFLPLDAQLQVQIGDRVRGGSSVVARWLPFEDVKIE
jgi:phosphatidylserine decarboxylase